MLTGTEISYYFICRRKLWYFLRRIDMEQTSELVQLGSFVSDNTYRRRKHEMRIDGISLDFYDASCKVIHEIKKSPAMEEAHRFQLKYYIHVLHQKGMVEVTGLIDYPQQRRRVPVELEPGDEEEIHRIEEDVNNLRHQETPPGVIDKPICQQCSYYELCYV